MSSVMANRLSGPVVLNQIIKYVKTIDQNTTIDCLLLELLEVLLIYLRILENSKNKLLWF